METNRSRLGKDLVNFFVLPLTQLLLISSFLLLDLLIISMPVPISIELFSHSILNNLDKVALPKHLFYSGQRMHTRQVDSLLEDNKVRV